MIRPMTIEDVRLLAAHAPQWVRQFFPMFSEEAQSYYAAGFAADILAKAQQQNSPCWQVKISEQGALLGAFCVTLPEGGVSTLIWLLVAPEAHGQGLGTALFHQACAQAKTLGAHKLKLTTPCPKNVAFYERMGMRIEGRHLRHWFGVDFTAMAIDI